MKYCSRWLALWIAGLVLVTAAEGRVCGFHYLAQHPDDFPLPRPKPAGARQSERIEVGTRLEFLVAGDRFLRPATCQYVGTHCYIFVEDAQWDTNGGSIYQTDVDALGELFERSTPADPERGIYELEVERFGPPPDVDGDERIFIVILDTGSPQLIGFFDPRVATWPDPALRRDAIHLNAAALRRRAYLARGTLAHEFQHLIHWGQDPDEEAWINEGLSGYAEALTGFPETDTSMVADFLARPDFNLTAWPSEARAANYGATYLFASFLAERYGSELLRWLVAEPRNGIFGVDAAFKAAGWVQNYSGAWAQWIVANYAADDPVYGYEALQGRRAKVFLAPPLPFEEVEGVVNQVWGTTNVLFRPGAGRPENIAVDFAGDEAGRYRVQGYAMRQGSGAVVELELDEAGLGRLEVEEVDSLVVVVGRTSLQGGNFRLSAREFANTAVGEVVAGLPERFELSEVYPNPFNGFALIPFALPNEADLELGLYNSLGQRVRTLRQGPHGAGRYEVGWNGLDDAGKAVGSGVYVVVLRAGAQQRVKQLTLMK